MTTRSTEPGLRQTFRNVCILNEQASPPDPSMDRVGLFAVAYGSDDEYKLFLKESIHVTS